MDTELAGRMVIRADKDGLPEDHDIRTKAQAFEDAAVGFYAADQTHTVKQLMGSWARAKRVWSEYTGEPMI